METSLFDFSRLISLCIIDQIDGRFISFRIVFQVRYEYVFGYPLVIILGGIGGIEGDD